MTKIEKIVENPEGLKLAREDLNVSRGQSTISKGPEPNGSYDGLS